MASALTSPAGDAPVWRALADPTRRRILDRLRAGPRTTGRLAVGFDMSRFGVMKHLRVLHEAGLILVEERGRERWNHVNPAPIREIYHRWIRPFEEGDADRLLRLKRHVEAQAERDAMNTTETPPVGVTNVLVEVLIEVPLQRVWDSMVLETTSWWHDDFYTSPEAKTFHIEPTLGGRMYEDWGEGNGQIWGHVTGVRAPEYLQIIGDQSKEWGGPARGIMTWRLDREGETTRLRLEHSLFGHVSEKTQESMEAGWLLLLRDCLKSFAETGQAPDFAKLKAPDCGH